MEAVLNIAPQLRSWIVHNLERGCAPEQLVGGMVEQAFEPAIARALVEAFVRSRRDGAPEPRESVVIELPPPDAPPTQRLPSGARIDAGDRMIPVVMRMQRPVIALLEDVLDACECDRLVALARTRLRPSTVVDPATGLDRVAGHRDSEGMFFALGETPFIDALDRRFSAIMGMPVENGEGLQVIRYGPRAASAPHFDFLVASNDANRASLARSGQRVSTLIAYLNDVAAGGDTVFPELGLAVSPRKGHGLYFEYADSAGRLDVLSAHAGGAVSEGEKWAVTKWMRERRFVPA
ncbi:MAG: 2OG-Fe(II) oxygenase [Usitatibacter sp.]